MPDSPPVHQVDATRDYQAQYADPIDVPAGALVRVERADEENSAWWWCVAADGRAGWVPAVLLDPPPAAQGHARVRETYTARELSVTRGDSLTIVREHAGWAFVRNRAEAEGWVPITCLGLRAAEVRPRPGP